MKLLLVILAAVCISKLKCMEGAEGSIPIFALRRFDADYYRINGSYDEVTCVKNINNTYLVHDRLCVTEEELYRKACSLSIVPLSGNKTTTVAILDSSTPNITHLKLASDRQELFKFNKTDQQVNSSFCDITSLEVFRGWEKAIQISHSGFSLQTNGSIEINKNELAYRVEDFTGELYRMNIACSNDALPERGCLFFKVLRNTSVTNAKFDCTVPGTLYDFTEECNITTAEEEVSVTTSPITTTRIVPMATNNPSAVDHMTTIYLFVVVGCGVPLLLVFALMACAIVCLLRRRLRSQKMQTAPIDSTEDQKEELQTQDAVELDDKSENFYHTLTPPEGETMLNGRDVENHTYAILETPQPQIHCNDSQKRDKRYPDTTMSSNAKPSEQVKQVMHDSLGHEYEAPVRKIASNRSQSLGHHPDPSEHVYAALDKGTMKTTRSASLSIRCNHYDSPPHEDRVEQPILGDESDCNNHHYHILEQPTATQHSPNNKSIT